MKSAGRECLASGGLCFKSLGTWGPCPWVQFELCTVQVCGLFLWHVLRKKWLTAHTLKWLILRCLPLHHSLCPSFFFFFGRSVFISTTEIKRSLHLTLYFPPGFPSLVVVLVFVFVVSICTPVSVVFVCFHCLHQYGTMGRIKPGRMTGLYRALIDVYQLTDSDSIIYGILIKQTFQNALLTDISIQCCFFNAKNSFGCFHPRYTVTINFMSFNVGFSCLVNFLYIRYFTLAANIITLFWEKKNCKLKP